MDFASVSYACEVRILEDSNGWSMTYDEMLAHARTIEGQVLHTVKGREFTVGVYMDCPFFIPSSTRLGRSDGRKAAERFVERYNESRSPWVRDYQDITRNASYLLALAESFERRDDR